jgi:hypothetical protein
MKHLNKIKIALICVFLLNSSSSYALSWWEKMLGEKEVTYYFGDQNKDTPDGIKGNHVEKTRGEVKSKYNILLPPYNREDAATSDKKFPNCANQFNLGMNMKLIQTCAQEVPNNSYKHPKIRIKRLLCPLAACYALGFDLNGIEGECNYNDPVQYGYSFIGNTRVCARISSPGVDGIKDDQSYPKDVYVDANNQPIKDINGNIQYRGMHLDTFGVNQWDDLYKSDPDENNKITEYPILMPKICAYEDPWIGENLFSQALEGHVFVPDLFDFDPTHQVFHYQNGDISPVAKIIISLVNMCASYTTLEVQLVSLIVEAIFGTISSSAKSTIESITKPIEWFIQEFAKAIADMLEAIGQVNMAVTDEYGCVNIPLGAYPPQYCHTLESNDPDPFVEQICSKVEVVDPADKTKTKYVPLQNCYQPQSSSEAYCSTQRCATSTTENNFIHNAVRVGYTNQVAFCGIKTTNTSGTTDTSGTKNTNTNCVGYKGDIPTRAELISKGNLIQKSDLDIPVSIPYITRDNYNYRVLYLTRSMDGSSNISIDYYPYADLAECSGDENQDPVKQYQKDHPQYKVSEKSCQQVWGVDLGDFQDLVIDYTQLAADKQKDQVSTAQTTLKYIAKSSGSSTSASTLTNTFYASINGQGSTLSADSPYINDLADQICVYQIYKDTKDTTNPPTPTPDINVECVSRAPKPNITVEPCTSTACSANYCTNVNSHVQPCMKVNLTSEHHSLQSSQLQNKKFDLNDESFNPKPESPQPLPLPPVYLAGMAFKGYVTDDNNQMPSFTFKDYTGSPVNDVNQLMGSCTDENNKQYACTSQNSILGKYVATVVSSISSDFNDKSKYLYGLEVVSGNYVRGGKWFCLNDDPSYDPQCSSDYTQCVLTNYADPVANKKASSFSPDRVNPLPPLSVTMKNFNEDKTGSKYFYDAQDPTGMVCFNDKIAKDDKYKGIIQCLPKCSSTITTSCLSKDPTPESTQDCQPKIMVYSYKQDDVLAPKGSSQAQSTATDTGVTPNASIRIGVTDNKELAFTKTSVDATTNTTKSLVTDVVSMDIDTGLISITQQTPTSSKSQSQTSADSKSQGQYTITTINPNATNQNDYVKTSAPENKDSTTVKLVSTNPADSENKDSISTNPEPIKSGTKTLSVDLNSLTMTLSDSSGKNPTVTVSIPLYQVINGTNKLNTNGVVVVEKMLSPGNTQTIAFDPSSSSSWYSSTKTNADGSSTTNVYDPKSNTNTITTTTTQVDGNVTTTTVTTAIQNLSTLVTTTSKVVTTTTIDTEKQTSTTVVETTDTNGKVSTTDPKVAAYKPSYCYTQTPTVLGPNQVVRTKVGAERSNRCIPVPPPVKCGAQTEHRNSNNDKTNPDANAIYPEGTDTGNLVPITCKADYVPAAGADMQAYCLLAYDKATYPSIWKDHDPDHSPKCVKAPPPINADSKNRGYNLNDFVIKSDANARTLGFSVGDGYNAIRSDNKTTSVTNTFYINFNKTNSNNLQFTKLNYDDGVKITVNSGAPYTVFGADKETSMLHKKSGADLKGLNELLRNNLKNGINTITIELITFDGGQIAVDFEY